VVYVVSATPGLLQLAVQIVSVMDDDECVQMIEPAAGRQKLPGSLNGAMVGTGICDASIASAATYFDL
jgi:hypothetical protein